MRSALVLNATYEPLSVVSARRAVCLVLSDKADIVEDDGTEVHAENFSMPGPLVIRLRYVVKVPYHRRTALSRRAVFARDDHRCQYCGGVADSIPTAPGAAASAPVVAAAFHPSLAPVGVLLGTVGYATGTGLAYVTGLILKWMAGA